MFQIRHENLPDFVKDEETLNVLFAPLRSKSVNPKDWEHKISCWKTIIKTYCECNDVYSFSFSSLSTVFVRHGRPPTCLPEVLSEMAKDGETQVMEVFLKKYSDSWTGWATDLLIKRPLSWSFAKIKNTIIASSPTVQNYVHLQVVKIKAECLLSTVSDAYKNKLISFRELLDVTDNKISNIDNVKLLLHYLVREKKILVTNLNNGGDELDDVLIKFGDGNNVSPISEIDVGVYTLEKNEKLISKHVEALEDEIERCVKEAKSHLAKNHRHMAKSCLIKKRNVEKRLEKKANALHNIQTLLEQIKDTHSDTHVWEAYKNALTAFNTTYKETGMTEDAVENTMLELGEVLDLHEDIQSALARHPKEEDTSDLEAELAELMENDSNNQPPNDDSGLSNDLEKELEKLNLNLPEVPDGSPEIAKQRISLN